MSDSGFAQRVRQTISTAFTKWNVLGTLTLLSGIIIGLGVPIWQELWLKTPEITVELNGIKQGFADNASVLLGPDDPSLSVIYRAIPTSLGISPLYLNFLPSVQARRFASPYSFSPNEIADIISFVKQQISNKEYLLRFQYRQQNLRLKN
jgi:hypothetical protein